MKKSRTSTATVKRRRKKKVLQNYNQQLIEMSSAVWIFTMTLAVLCYQIQGVPSSLKQNLYNGLLAQTQFLVSNFTVCIILSPVGPKTKSYISTKKSVYRSVIK